MDSLSHPPESFKSDLIAQREYMMRVAMARCHNKAEAEDLAQTAAMKALNSWHQFEPGTNFKAWLARIITNQFLSDRRNKYSSTRIDDPEGLFEDRMTSNLPGPEVGMTVEAVFRAIDKLPKDQKDAIFFVIEGCSYEEMARRANCAVGTAKSRVNRAREALAAMLPGEEMDFLDSRWADLAGTKPVLLGPYAGPRLLSAPSHAVLPSPPTPRPLSRRPEPLALPAPKRPQPEHKLPPLVSRLENNEKDADVELPIQQKEKVSMSMPQPPSTLSTPAMPGAPVKSYRQTGTMLADVPIANDIPEIIAAYAAIGVTSSMGMIQAVMEIDPSHATESSMKIYLGSFLRGGMLEARRPLTLTVRLPALIARRVGLNPVDAYGRLFEKMSKEPKLYWIDSFDFQYSYPKWPEKQIPMPPGVAQPLAKRASPSAVTPGMPQEHPADAPPVNNSNDIVESGIAVKTAEARLPLPADQSVSGASLSARPATAGEIDKTELQRSIFSLQAALGQLGQSVISADDIKFDFAAISAMLTGLDPETRKFWGTVLTSDANVQRQVASPAEGISETSLAPAITLLDEKPSAVPAKSEASNVDVITGDLMTYALFKDGNNVALRLGFNAAGIADRHQLTTSLVGRGYALATVRTRLSEMLNQTSLYDEHGRLSKMARIMVFDIARLNDATGLRAYGAAASPVPVKSDDNVASPSNASPPDQNLLPTRSESTSLVGDLPTYPLFANGNNEVLRAALNANRGITARSALTKALVDQGYAPGSAVAMLGQLLAQKTVFTPSGRLTKIAETIVTEIAGLPNADDLTRLPASPPVNDNAQNKDNAPDIGAMKSADREIESPGNNVSPSRVEAPAVPVETRKAAPLPAPVEEAPAFTQDEEALLFHDLCAAFHVVADQLTGRGVDTLEGLWQLMPEAYRGKRNNFVVNLDEMTKSRTPFLANGNVKPVAGMLSMALTPGKPIRQLWEEYSGNVTASAGARGNNRNFGQLMRRYSPNLVRRTAKAQGWGKVESYTLDTKAELQSVLIPLLKGIPVEERGPKLNDYLSLFTNDTLVMKDKCLSPLAIEAMELFDIPSAEVIKAFPPLASELIYTDMVRRELPALAELMRMRHLVGISAVEYKSGKIFQPQLRAAITGAMQANSAKDLDATNPVIAALAESFYETPQYLMSQPRTPGMLAVAGRKAASEPRTSG